MDDHFTFIPPQECPVFRPTKEEFRDPLEYIDQIKPIAIKSGICKIIPPDDWRPPFSVNVNTFQFTPRVQKLYELEAQSRVKLNFMTKLSQFISLQGNDKLKVPNISGKHVDLYKLHKLVNEEGGYDHVTANKLWPKIGNKLGYKISNQVHALRTNYEKIILPYDLMFMETHNTHIFDTQSISKPRPVLHPSTTKKRKSIESVTIDPTLLESNHELKRLQFVGAGPRMFNGTKEEFKYEDELISGPLKRKCLSDFLCRICGNGDHEDRLLICDNEECQESYHCECLIPPVTQIPKQSWKCQKCVLKVLNIKPIEYGFPSSSTTYTLYDFGRSADRFKANYFGKELHEVLPCSIVEKEFWRILQSFNDDVIVEYGADIHSSHQGSGFPTIENIENGRCTRNNGEPNMELAVKYSKEAWNLNNLPLNKKSILSYIRGNIDGMKVPWCYVGMVFSSFCWHIEDHWSFSINYLHWGEPKTWYGVSSDNAVEFEAAMKKQAPELFENNEDLLHHITTTMNPNILQREGVPIYRTDQHAGQFVVTFPRAYHAGFNQGFNFAEAVNFCPATWLPMGRACIEQYAQLRRHCVFSHEELLCTLAEAALLEFDDIDDETLTVKYPLVSQLGLPRDQIRLDTNIRRVVHSELEVMLQEEEKCRARVKSIGITKIKRRLFENMEDDERACAICQTTMFLSAMECMCVSVCHNADEDNEDIKDEPVEMEEGELNDNDNETESVSVKTRRIVCMRHLDNVCAVCPLTQCTLLYRFDLDQIRQMLLGLEVRLQDFHSWETAIKAHFTEGPINGQKRGSLDQLRLMLDEGAECGFDSCDEYVKGRGLLERGDNLVSVCNHWLRAIQDTEDCGKAVTGTVTGSASMTPSLSVVPKSVLVDCVHDNGARVEIKNINVANLSEENLGHMSQTLARFPVNLPCGQFEQMVTRLLQWRQDSHSVMDSYKSPGLPATDHGSLLPRVVALFDEARRLFPGWSAFSYERTCLMLMGKSLQWLVRIRECEDAVKKGRTTVAHCLGSVGGGGDSVSKNNTGGSDNGAGMSLPSTLVKDTVLTNLVSHGQTLVASVKDATIELGDLGHRFLGPVTLSIESCLVALDIVLQEMAHVRDEAMSLAKRPLSSALLSCLRSATDQCLCLGVRVKELDDARVKIYKSSVEAILAGKPGRYLCLEHATQVLELGGALFTESVLDRNNGPMTQRHLAAKAQVAVVSRAVRKLRTSYMGFIGGSSCLAESNPGTRHEDRDLLAVLLPRYYSADQDISKARLVDNCTQFLDAWLSMPVTTAMSAVSNGGPSTDAHIAHMMAVYQALMIDELASMDEHVSRCIDKHKDDHRDIANGKRRCPVCTAPVTTTTTSSIEDNNNKYCQGCAPRTRRPSIADMAQLNKLLKQCPTIVSVHGVALQAMSKRTVTWLESLVTLLRVNSKYLATHYWSLSDHRRQRKTGGNQHHDDDYSYDDYDYDDNDHNMDPGATTIPVCIRELFGSHLQSSSSDPAAGTIRPHKSVVSDMVANLEYLFKVGHCLEVNVDSYLAVISGLLSSIQRDMHQHCDDHCH